MACGTRGDAFLMNEPKKEAVSSAYLSYATTQPLMLIGLSQEVSDVELQPCIVRSRECRSIDVATISESERVEVFLEGIEDVVHPDVELEVGRSEDRDVVRDLRTEIEERWRLLESVPAWCLILTSRVGALVLLDEFDVGCR